MKKVLVTGSEGFIGQHLVELLLRKGFEVIGVDLCWYNEAFILPNTNKYKLLKLDFHSLTEDYLKDVDCVCHLAAISNDPMGDLDPNITLVTNKQKTISFAEKCKFWGVKRFIFQAVALFMVKQLRTSLMKILFLILSHYTQKLNVQLKKLLSI